MSDFKAKMHQIRFPLGNLQRSPEPLYVFKGPIFKGREEKGTGSKKKGENKGKGKGREEEGRKGREEKGGKEW